MIETFFDCSFAIDRLRQGPLYSRIQLRYIGHLNRWLDRKGLTVKQIDEDMIERFWHSFMRRKKVRRCDMSALFTLLDLLREQGVTPQRTIKAVLTPRESHVENYNSYLREERGLSYDSIRNMLPFVDQLLLVEYPQNHIDFRLLKADDTTTFVRKQAAQLGSMHAKHMVTALRGFLRYLRHRGDIDTDLAGCFPYVPQYSFSTVPRFLPTGSVEKLLQLTDQSTPTGRRDRAMLMFLARLGLRTCEIVRLELEDIDWELGQITIRGKGGRWSKLPLPPNVGNAVATYLQHDRPRCSTRRVFVTQRAPMRGLSSGYCGRKNGDPCSETRRHRLRAERRLPIPPHLGDRDA